jgi:trimethylamine-N-oxide reductase (cytochrome c)
MPVASVKNFTGGDEMNSLVLKAILLGVPLIITRTARKYPEFRRTLQKHNCVIQIQLKDGSIGRHYIFENGKIKSKAGLHPAPDASVIFKDIPTALTFLKPPFNQAEIVHAAKNFRVVTPGRSEILVWFMQLMYRTQTIGLQYGTPQKNGTRRYTTGTNSGPLFVYVKDDKIIRMTPIDLDESDAPSWTIKARGKEFRPYRRTTSSPYSLALKSMVYSDKRHLYPMKRVDWDPNGERNPQNRGKSEFVRISWDEALDLVAGEIKRMKRQHGPGAIAVPLPSHHQWGNIGYYLSSLMRFQNLIGTTRVHPNPDSWEGWYWGAMHHYGNALRLGIPDFYGTVEDCLKEAEQIVFWASDPETTNGLYAAFEGTQRRLWAKKLGIEFIHIDPHLTPTAQLLGGRWIPIRPATDTCLAQAIMYVWIKEGTYDKDYVATRTTGFDEWRAYLLGETDGVAKTPEWQENETGVPAHVCRALARSWAKKKTYLGAGGLGAGWGGAARNATGAQWARSMILMMAMQGWGKPGRNFGNLQFGAPLDYNFYFPGYAEGGISGELNFTAAALNNYTRMPHAPTLNPVKQIIPRQQLPEAILEGKCTGYMWDGSSMEAQMFPFSYPAPGHSKIHMIYRYGNSTFGTISDSSRFLESYRHPSIECVVNQSIWMEGDAKYADIILPACTSFERWDIGDWAGCSGYIHHNHSQLNHRMVVLQHKCIEPLGESKSDYQIFLDILNRLGLGTMFSEGCSELDWCKRVFESTDVAKKISWKEFVKKGYYVVPPEPEATRDPVAMRWFAEDRHKDMPEPLPFPAQFGEEMAKGLETQSGKIEFVSSSLKRLQPAVPERPPLNKYIPAWEGPHSTDLYAKYPLLMVSSHPRYSFHTYGDAKNSTVNDVVDHRVNIDGYFYWVMRINPADADKRGIKHRDLVRVFNGRGNGVFVTDVSALVPAGVVKTYESCADVDAYHHDKYGIVEFSGCANVLTSKRTQVPGTESIAPNSCLVEIEKWTVPMRELKRA